MNTQLKLYTNKYSRGVMVIFLLKELGVNYEEIQLEYGAQMKSNEYLRLNPFGKVSTLVDGEIVVSELVAIHVYLADKYIYKGFYSIK